MIPGAFSLTEHPLHGHEKKVSHTVTKPTLEHMIDLVIGKSLEAQHLREKEGKCSGTTGLLPG